jgi:hypothetical protein
MRIDDSGVLLTELDLACVQSCSLGVNESEGSRLSSLRNMSELEQLRRHDKLTGILDGYNW